MRWGLLLLVAVVPYNGPVTKKNGVDNAVASIDVMLKKVSSKVSI